MPQFVILEHDFPERHFDFMLEAGDVLRTWKLSVPPQTGQTVDAELSFDHRAIYLNYEGPISGNRGAVVRWDKGSFDWKLDQENRVSLQIFGERLRGCLELVRGVNNRWQVTLGD